MGIEGIEIIDFHTHPFIEAQDNICAHKNLCHMGVEDTREVLTGLGISKFCGSVLRPGDTEGWTPWDKVRHCNDVALELRDLYGGAYIPGFHVHPDYIDESIEEIRRMAKLGVKLIGELVPSYFGWKDYSSEAFSVLLDEAEKHGMVVNLHTQGNDEMDAMVQRHPNLVIIGAHPNEYDILMRHVARAKLSDNYYIDLSGTGVTRYGALRRLIDCVGADRLVFGTDFPTCNPNMWIGALVNDRLITDDEKEKILSLNAKRLLGI